jgi:hypothetical protein
MQEFGRCLESGEVHGVESKLGRNDLGEHLGGGDTLFGNNVVDLAPGLERLVEEFLSRFCGDVTGVLEEFGDLVGVHDGLSGCRPSCWR